MGFRIDRWVRTVRIYSSLQPSLTILDCLMTGEPLTRKVLGLDPFSYYLCST